MTYVNQLRRNITRVMRRVLNFFPSKIAVEIDNKVYYFTEYELRAMQIVVKNMTDEQFAEFNQRVIIYSGRYKRTSHRVEICRDGYLDEPIQLFSAIADLSHELL